MYLAETKGLHVASDSSGRSKYDGTDTGKH